MKHLQDYMEAKQSELYESTGAYFAFNKKQIEEGKKEGVKYVSMGYGLICPKDNADRLYKGLGEIWDNAIAQDLKENGKEAIIRRELANHECYYTGDPLSILEGMEPYGITGEEIMTVYHNTQKEMSADE